ncbi:MAG: outer membrane protein assembly factor BamA [Phycisphaerae bacterium]|nr:outer membrane protein assembly factor BamA [Phycisphaerae bacterium]
MRPIRGLVVLFSAIIGFAAIGTASAQDQPAQDGMVIERVDIRGLETISEGFIRRSLRTRVGQAFDRAQVEEDVRELLRTRKFINVYADTSVEGGRAVVVFVLREKPEIVSVALVGNHEFKDEDLYELIPSPGQPLDSYEVRRAQEELLRKYREAGYYYAEVTIDERLLEEQRELVYQISEGPRVKVRKIEFEGVQSFSTRRLKSKVQTKTYIWIFRKGAFDAEQAERDALDVERFYREEGYLDARVGYRLEFDEVERSDLRVVFVVEEGPRYSVAEVLIEGSEAIDEARLREGMNLSPGAYFRDAVLQEDVRRIRDMYGEIGYVDVRVSAIHDFLAEPEVVRLRYVIQENRRSRFGRITIRGNSTTQDRVIRRELRFFPGEDYNVLKTREAEQRLRETSLFSQATITPLDDVEGEREALVEVEEADAILFLIGGGVSTDSGVLGSVMLENRNFDLFGFPRTAGEFFRGQAFRGAGQRLRFSAEPGTELTRFRIDFVEPYLLDKPLRLSTSLYLFQRGRDSYDEQRFGMTVGLGRRFESGPLKDWAVEGRVRLESVDIKDVDALAAREIREAKDGGTLTSIKGSLVRDTTDSRFRPTRGYRFDLSWEQVGALGGDYTFGQPSAGITWYKTLHTDIFERKSVLGLRGDVSYIVGDAPVFERYYAGGFGSMRGFEYRGISPRNGIRDDAVGGDFITLVGAEYSFPLYGKSLRGVTFLDMGTVEEDLELTDWRASVGFGLRIDVDFFGPVPIVLDFGFPIAKNDDDETQVFNFSFGASF